MAYFYKAIQEMLSMFLLVSKLPVNVLRKTYELVDLLHHIFLRIFIFLAPVGTVGSSNPALFIPY